MKQTRNFHLRELIFCHVEWTNTCFPLVNFACSPGRRQRLLTPSPTLSCQPNSCTWITVAWGKWGVIGKIFITAISMNGEYRYASLNDGDTFREMRRCANVIDFTYTNLDNIAYYTPSLYIVYCFFTTNLYIMFFFSWRYNPHWGLYFTAL